MTKLTDPDLSVPLFTDRESFEAWLKGKPDGWSVDLATRSALRAGAMLWPDHEPDALSSFMADLLLQTHRALFILNSISGDNKQRQRAAESAANAANAAYSAAYAVDADASAYAAANAAYAKTTNAADAANTAAYAAANAVFAAVAADYADAAAADYAAAAAAYAAAAVGYAASANAYVTAARVAWTELEQDAQFLIHSDRRSGLFYSPLWQERPVWVNRRFATACKGHWAQGPFNFWLAWYRQILFGQSTGTVIAPIAAQDLAFADNAFWTPDEKRPADQIMREICERVGWDWEKAQIEPLPPVERRSEDTLGLSTSPPHARAEASELSVTSTRSASDTTQSGLSSDETESQELDSETLEPERQSDPELHLTDSADIQHDNPTLKDELGRSPFVEVMVDRLQSLHADQLKRGQGFAINLHAPWGAGKSTILKMMEARLTTDRSFKDRWIVVNFNAWENERRRPPWWAMLEAVYRGIRDGLGLKWRAGLIFARWVRFNFMGNVFPVLVAMGVVAACTYLVWTLGLENNAGKVVTSVITALVTLAGTGFLVARGLVFGSKQYAEQHEVMTRDTLGRVRKLFKSLIDITDRPLCIMIDDLDRCDADYLVELLEGIQTAFRHPNVVYVVAADRKWIKSAFEHRYKDAFAQVEGMGQPLGYLFLEKIFQLSTPLPAPSHNAQRRYWQKLLGEDGEAQSLSPQPTAEDLRQLREQAQSRIETANTYEEIEAIVGQSEKSDDSEALQDEIRSAAFERASRSETIEREAKHRLAQLSTIIPFNPRNMKRLLNTYTLRVGEGFSGGVKPEVLARWVVLEHSYPELTDLLAEQPDLAKHFQEEAEELKDLPPLVQHCRDRKAVSEIFWKTVEGVSAPLTVEDVRKLTRSMV